RSDTGGFEDVPERRAELVVAVENQGPLVAQAAVCLEEAVLFEEVIEHALLMAVEPAGEDDGEDVKNRGCGRARCRDSAAAEGCAPRARSTYSKVNRTP